MSFKHLPHLLHSISHSEKHAKMMGKKGEMKVAAVAYIVVGFFLAPMLIGIPIMIVGFYKLFK